MKNKPLKSYAVLGLQFTSMMITPVVVCILIGYYFEKKYNLGSWFMNLCVFVSIALLIFNLISFARRAIRISENQKNSRRNKHEDNSTDKN